MNKTKITIKPFSKGQEAGITFWSIEAGTMFKIRQNGSCTRTAIKITECKMAGEPINYACLETGWLYFAKSEDKVEVFTEVDLNYSLTGGK